MNRISARTLTPSAAGWLLAVVALVFGPLLREAQAQCACGPNIDYSVSTNYGTNSVVLTQGTSEGVIVTLCGISGGKCHLQYGISDLPAGVTITFVHSPTGWVTDPNSPATFPCVILSGEPIFPDIYSFLINAGASAPPGNYSATISVSISPVCGGGGPVRQTVLNIEVRAVEQFDFSLSADTNALTVNAGEAGSSTINASLTSGTSEPVTFSLSGLPAGAGATFTPSDTCTPTCSATLTLSTGATTPAGIHNITVTATTGGTSPVTKQTGVTLTVNQRAVLPVALADGQCSDGYQGDPALGDAPDLPSACIYPLNPPRIHRGTDVARQNKATGNLPNILSIGSGTVTFKGALDGFGNAVVIRYPRMLKLPDGPAQDVYALYAHLSSVSVNQGDSVTPGQVIGRMGNTDTALGTASGNLGVHLHLELSASPDILVKTTPRLNPAHYINLSYPLPPSLKATARGKSPSPVFLVLSEVASGKVVRPDRNDFGGEAEYWVRDWDYDGEVDDEYAILFNPPETEFRLEAVVKSGAATTDTYTLSLIANNVLTFEDRNVPVTQARAYEFHATFSPEGILELIVPPVMLKYLPPVNGSAANNVNVGRTFPVKVTAMQGNILLVHLKPEIRLVKGDYTTGGSTTEQEITQASSSEADTTGIMRYSPTDGHYIYNLSTSGLAKNTKYTLIVRVRDSDGVVSAESRALLVTK
jgi:murein DD-endopeptidase MepM/ murein hydrolase activator NlpD